jgi:ABC-type metal ion transport system substrate-binding protein
MQVTSTIFLSPMVLHKSWIFELKSQVESKYNFVIVKIDSLDSPRCAKFVWMISHKNIKNMVEKWYSKYLNKFGLTA